MNFFLDLFSPATYQAFTESTKSVSGFRSRHRSTAQRVAAGDRLLCYMTKLSRWMGVLEVLSGPFDDDSPIFYPTDDPFVVRFNVTPLVWLNPEHGIPIRAPEVWSNLSFTRNHDLGSTTWTGKVRTSLNQIEDNDARFLEQLLFEQTSTLKSYPLTESEQRQLVTHQVRRSEGTIIVSVPEDEQEETIVPERDVIRDSIKVQAQLAELGSNMGMKIWIPRNDRGRVLGAWTDRTGSLLNALPLNYDTTTLQTIENIDVIWMKGRAIVRAFEVEHTTAIYSGILRMADLLALQPNMDIRLHIVAPETRREKVFDQLKRPVFSLLERQPLSKICSFLSYERLEELSRLPHLRHLADSIVDEYADDVDEAA